MSEVKQVPSHLCSDCADKFEDKYKVLGYGYTIFIGVCPICGEEKELASAKDYGILLNKEE